MEVGCRKKPSWKTCGDLCMHITYTVIYHVGGRKKKNYPPSLRVSGTRCTVRFHVYHANTKYAILK